jgi:hypothetical protein
LGKHSDAPLAPGTSDAGQVIQVYGLMGAVKGAHSDMDDGWAQAMTVICGDLYSTDDIPEDLFVQPYHGILSMRVGC